MKLELRKVSRKMVVIQIYSIESIRKTTPRTIFTYSVQENVPGRQYFNLILILRYLFIYSSTKSHHVLVDNDLYFPVVARG